MVTKPLASLLSLAVVVALSTAGALACPCGDTSTASAPSCHDTGPGLTTAPKSCGCACMYSAPAQPAAPRIEPVVVAALPHGPSPGPALAPRLAPTVAVDAAPADPPAPLRFQILRI
jgi:hypothetical protein